MAETNSRKQHSIKKEEALCYIISFQYNEIDYYGLCIGWTNDGKLINYRVKKKEKTKFPKEILVEDSTGAGLGYVVDYRSKFCIPLSCVRKRILRCDIDFIKRINREHNALPPLEELIDKCKELKNLYYHTPSKEKRKVLDQLGQVNSEIAARRAEFLHDKPKKKEPLDKYRNFRIMPNRNGITRIYSGGGCSGKK